MLKLNRFNSERGIKMSTRDGNGKITIRMVAQEAGVSVGSVSNYLNRSTKLSAETSQKIAEAIKKLDYSPDIIAGSMRRKNSTDIIVLSPNLNNTFHTNTLSTYTDLANENGYFIHTYGFQYTPELERKGLIRAKRSRCCLVVVFNGEGDEEEIQALVESGMPVLLADRRANGLHVNSVAFDNTKIFEEIVREVKNKGYRRLGVLTEPPTLSNLHRRYTSLVKEAEKAGIRCGKEEFFSDKTLQLDNLTNGYLFMSKILSKYAKDELPVCWICSSDNLAIGALKAFRKYHYKVPQDFSIIGFDDINVASFVNPELTTVEQNQRVLGEKLWEMTKISLSGNVEGNEFIIPQKLIRRETF